MVDVIADHLPEDSAPGGPGAATRAAQSAQKVNAIGDILTFGYLAEGAIVPNTPEGRAALAGSDEVAETIAGEVGAAVPPAVATALASDETIREAAASAVTTQIAARSLVERVEVLRSIARAPEQIIAGAITRNVNGVVTSAAVQWPDGTAGVYTATPSTSFPTAVDTYQITYGVPTAIYTFTQPAPTRDSSGVTTVIPAITVTAVVPDTTAPSTPTSVVVDLITSTSARVSWSPSSDDRGVVAYDVYDGATLLTSVAAAPAALTGLAAGSSHSITVRARDAAGNTSAASASAPFTTVPYGFVDEFDGPTGAIASDRHSPTGNKTGVLLKVSSATATPTITSTGRLQIPDGTSNAAYGYDAATAQGEFQTTIAYIDSDKAPFIAAWATDYNNGLFLTRNNSTDKFWQLGRRVGGSTVEVLYTGTTAIVAAAISITRAGDTFTLKIAGVTVWTGTASGSLPGTIFAVGCATASFEMLYDRIAFIPA